jgi:hypothetical protein
VGASYYDGSAAHLDLAHWATDPTWSDLTPDQRERLLEDGRSFLQWQLSRPHLRLVMLNGRAVILQFELWSGCPLQPVGQLPGPLGRAANLFRATLPGGCLKARRKLVRVKGSNPANTAVSRCAALSLMS